MTSKTKKVSKSKKSGPVAIVIKGTDRARDLIHEWSLAAITTKSGVLLNIAAELAKANPVPKTEYRALRTAIVKALTSDKAIKADIEAAGISLNRWRQDCYDIGAAAVAMLASPKTTFTSMRTNATTPAAIKKAGAAATLGQTFINKDGKPDSRAKNAKVRKAPKAPKLRGAKAAEHPADASRVQIKARNMGSAMVGMCRAVGAVNAVLAETAKGEVPDAAVMHALLLDVSKAGQKLAKEWDSLREKGGTRYEIETGTDAPTANLI